MVKCPLIRGGSPHCESEAAVPDQCLFALRQPFLRPQFTQTSALLYQHDVPGASQYSLPLGFEVRADLSVMPLHL